MKNKNKAGDETGECDGSISPLSLCAFFVRIIGSVFFRNFTFWVEFSLEFPILYFLYTKCRTDPWFSTVLAAAFF